MFTKIGRFFVVLFLVFALPFWTVKSCVTGVHVKSNPNPYTQGKVVTPEDVRCERSPTCVLDK